MKTQSTLSFISELRPHTAAITLYCWIIVTIKGSGDWVTSTEGDAAAPVSCLRTGPGVSAHLDLSWPWTRLGQRCAATWLSCASPLRNKPTDHRSSLSPVKSHFFTFTRGVSVFLKHKPKLFPAIHQTLIGLTCSLHMPRLQGLTKRGGSPADVIAAVSILGSECCWILGKKKKKKKMHNDRNGFY